MRPHFVNPSCEQGFQITASRSKIGSTMAKAKKASSGKKKTTKKKSKPSALEALSTTAKAFVAEVQKRVTKALETPESADQQKADYAKMRKEWVKKRLSRSALGKKLLVKSAYSKRGKPQK